jgi:hypothetical protein
MSGAVAAQIAAFELASMRICRTTPVCSCASAGKGTKHTRAARSIDIAVCIPSDYQFAAARFCQGFGPGAHAELSEQRLDVKFHGAARFSTAARSSCWSAHRQAAQADIDINRSAGRKRRAERGEELKRPQSPSARLNAAAAASAAAVRTWFQAVQLVRYAAHSRAPCAGSARASASFLGTLHRMVTSRVPTR